MITVLYFWKIPTKRIPRALYFMATQKAQLKKVPGVNFVKVLGTGRGETFTPADADVHRWGFLVTIDEKFLSQFDESDIIQRWRKGSHSEFRAVLEPISSHGKWSRQEPFTPTAFDRENIQIAAITRARIKWSQNFRFWRSVPPVTLSLARSKGLIGAIGIGEAPIGLQGTFSLWDSASALKEFAYKGKAHQGAIQATSTYKWYSEELFARFAIREVRGSL